MVVFHYNYVAVVKTIEQHIKKKKNKNILIMKSTFKKGSFSFCKRRKRVF